jgi:hypothetical protein
MSILDALNEFSDAQAVTATAITNVIDTGATNTLKNQGAGPPLYMVLITNTTCTDVSSDATVAFTLESDSTADLATSATVHWSSGVMAFAAYATAGTVIACIPLPSGQYERYVGGRYTVASGPLTAGKFDWFLTRDPSMWQAYANGNVV